MLPRQLRINIVSPSVLTEATSYHASFPGFPHTPASVAAEAYLRSIDGVETGQVFAV